MAASALTRKSPGHATGPWKLRFCPAKMAVPTSPHEGEKPAAERLAAGVREHRVFIAAPNFIRCERPTPAATGTSPKVSQGAHGTTVIPVIARPLDLMKQCLDHLV